MSLDASDVLDSDFVDALELRATGGAGDTYRAGVTVVSTTAATRRVVVSGFDPTGLAVGSRETPVEAGDRLVLAGTTGADGTWTVETVVDAATVQVVESIPDSTGGTADFRWSAGAGRVGVELPGYAPGTTLQDVLTRTMTAQRVGDVQYSRDGLTFTPATPIVSRGGWLKNSLGRLLVQ